MAQLTYLALVSSCVLIISPIIETDLPISTFKKMSMWVNTGSLTIHQDMGSNISHHLDEIVVVLPIFDLVSMFILFTVYLFDRTSPAV